MAQTIKLRRSATPGAAPTAAQIALGEVFINTYDGAIYFKKNVSGVDTVLSITGAVGGIPSGSRVLLATLTANNSVALQDTTLFSTAGYSSFEIEFVNLVPVTTGVNLYMRVYSGGAYQSANYASSGIIPSNYFVYGQSGGGAPSGPYLAQAVLSWITTSVSNAVAMGGLSGRLKVDNPVSDTTRYKLFYGQTDHSNYNWVGARMPALIGFAWNGGTGAVTGFQVYFSSGNISSGSIKIYGIKS